ncbi:MAG: YbhB/YbcL family Raf kinase inhibitor-like protein [Ardenticatenales bacterium]|nr:YbhB/YbcL family Raf kinase inhibitor-like protein [Ardenticatenales bacterium]
MIPEVYTCRAEATGISPPLAWTEPPPGTQSFALLVEDPDAGSTPFVHWVLFNLSPDLRALPENVPAGESLADGNRQGQNSRRAARYDGPCPPRGIHRYIFTLYALDIRLDPSQVQDKSTLLSASKGHILAQATLIGRFGE